MIKRKARNIKNVKVIRAGDTVRTRINFYSGEEILLRIGADVKVLETRHTVFPMVKIRVPSGGSVWLSYSDVEAIKTV